MDMKKIIIFVLVLLLNTACAELHTVYPIAEAPAGRMIIAEFENKTNITDLVNQVFVEAFTLAASHNVDWEPRPNWVLDMFDGSHDRYIPDPMYVLIMQEDDRRITNQRYNFSFDDYFLYVRNFSSGTTVFGHRIHGIWDDGENIFINISWGWGWNQMGGAALSSMSVGFEFPVYFQDRRIRMQSGGNFDLYINDSRWERPAYDWENLFLVIDGTPMLNALWISSALGMDIQSSFFETNYLHTAPITINNMVFTSLCTLTLLPGITVIWDGENRIARLYTQ